MRLPSAPRSSWPRIETGTSARSSRPSVRTPRSCSQLRSAPATTASTASLTVPPSAFLISLKSARRLWTQRTRRCGPISTLSGTSGAGFMPGPDDLAEALGGLAHTLDRLARVLERAERAARQAEGRLDEARTPSATRSTSEGSGAGVQSSSARARPARGRGRTGPWRCPRPTTPSTSAWCVFEISAKRPPSSPWMIQISQSGFERSRRCEKMRPARLRSWSSLPGFGSAVWRTW